MKPLKVVKRYINYHYYWSTKQKKQLVQRITTGLTKTITESRRLNIPLSTLRGWVNRFENGGEISFRRTKGGGRKPVLTKEFEISMYNWLIEKRDLGAPITTDIFLSKIKNSFRESDVNPYSKQPVFSRGFLTSYMRRFHLSLRTSSIVTPASLVQGTQLCDNIINLWKNCNNLRRTYKIPDSMIINLDEVPVWFDNSSLKVLDKKNKKHVRNRSNGRQKSRITVILAQCADGTKLPPLVIFKTLGSSEDMHEYFRKKFGCKIFFRSSTKSTSNIPIFVDYLANLFPDDAHKLLILDSSNTHGYKPKLKKIKGDVETIMTARNIHYAIIPEHTTPIVQPLDTHVNKIFKNKLKKYWADYMTENIDKLCSNGTVVDTDDLARILISDFVFKAWNEVDSSLVIKSFKDDGFSLKLDGSEEHLCRVHLKEY